MTAYITAVFLLIVTPGPGVLSMAGIGAAYGVRAATRHLFGLFLGTNFVALAVVSGAGTFFMALPLLRTGLLVVSSLFLLWIAWGVATAGQRLALRSAPNPGIRTGLLLQFLNPKAYAVNSVIFAGFPLFPDHLLWEFVLKLIIFNAVWLPLHLVWLGAGIWVRSLDLPARVNRAINVIMALSMLIVVALAGMGALE